MRVICINQNAWPDDVEDYSVGEIKDGEVYEVIDVEFDEGYIWFVLSIDEHHTYWENCFARCSDKDEALKEVEDFESGKKVPMSFAKFLKTLF